MDLHTFNRLPATLTVRDVAQYLRVTLPTVRLYIRTGRLPALNAGTEKKPRYLIQRSDLAERLTLA